MASDPALAADVFARCCESRRTMLEITGTWGTLVLVALGDGTHRFGELRRRIDGVSERMLSQTLQQLERDESRHHLGDRGRHEPPVRLTLV